jgi:hypothetical protein
MTDGAPCGLLQTILHFPSHTLHGNPLLAQLPDLVEEQLKGGVELSAPRLHQSSMLLSRDTDVAVQQAESACHELSGSSLNHPPRISRATLLLSRCQRVEILQMLVQKIQELTASILFARESRSKICLR